MRITTLALAALLFIAPLSAHAEPCVCGGGYHDGGKGGGHSSPLTGPSGYHDPAVPTHVTSSSLAAYGAAVLARIGR